MSAGTALTVLLQRPLQRRPLWLLLQLAIAQLRPMWSSSTRVNTRPSLRLFCEQSTLVCKFADLKR